MENEYITPQKLNESVRPLDSIINKISEKVPIKENLLTNREEIAYKIKEIIIRHHTSIPYVNLQCINEKTTLHGFRKVKSIIERITSIFQIHMSHSEIHENMTIEQIIDNVYKKVNNRNKEDQSNVYITTEVTEYDDVTESVKKIIAEMNLVASAVVHQGKVYTGLRHGDAIQRAVEDTGTDNVLGEEGFVDENGDFYCRHTAAIIAFENGQLQASECPKSIKSEDLW